MKSNSFYRNPIAAPLKGRRFGLVPRITCDYKMDEQEYQALVAKVGTEAADKIRAQGDAMKLELTTQINTEVSKNVTEAEKRINAEITAAEGRINAKAAELRSGLLTEEAFGKFKDEEIKVINEKLEAVARIEEASKAQGIKINELLEKSTPKQQSFEDYLINNVIGEKGEKLMEIKKTNSFVEIPLSQMKEAGVTSISNVIQAQDNVPTSPYLPGIGGAELAIFDIKRDPNFILDKVDMGRTNQSRIAWINETGELGLPAEVDEGGEKPMLQNTFKVEQSFAKKIAAYIKITEEFEQDVPQLATLVRRLLQTRIIRGWDDAIQAAIYAIATPFSAPGLTSSIPFANFWDGIYAMMAQVRVDHFIPNSVSIHPYTNVKMQADKTSTGVYLLPPFKDEITSMLTQANKIAVDNALVGDLKQYKVDVYKEFVLKVGWVNDDFIHNQFCVLGELRYHRYISDNRKKAIVKGNLGNVVASLDGGQSS